MKQGIVGMRPEFYSKKQRHNWIVCWELEKNPEQLLRYLKNSTTNRIKSYLKMREAMVQGKAPVDFDSLKALAGECEWERKWRGWS